LSRTLLVFTNDAGSYDEARPRLAIAVYDIFPEKSA